LDVVFWEDRRPNGGGTHIHFPGTNWSPDVWQKHVIQWEPNTCNWDVWFGHPDGSWDFLGTSTSNCPGSGSYLSAGIETTTQATSNTARGWLFNWMRLDSSRTWQNDWYGPTVHGDNWPFINWTDCSPCVETEEVLNEGW
jgi:hypothetical protein